MCFASPNREGQFFLRKAEILYTKAMKFALCSGLLVGATLVSHASFEMMILVDHTNKQFLRYDPLTNASLGSFGRGQWGTWGNAPSIALDTASPGSIASLDISGFVHKIDYSTGESRGTLALAGSASGGSSFFSPQLKVLGNGNYLVQSSLATAPMIFDRNTGAVVSSMTTYAGFDTLDVAPMSDGTYVTLERSGTGTYTFSLFRRNAAGAYMNSTSVASSIVSNRYYQITIAGNKAYLAGYDGTTPAIGSFTIGASSFMENSVYYSATSGNPGTNIMVGHGSNAYFLQSDPTNGAKLYDFNTTTSFFSPRLNTAFTQTLGPKAVIVVAPEPASLLALGLGGLALVRRRRSK